MDEDINNNKKKIVGINIAIAEIIVIILLSFTNEKFDIIKYLAGAFFFAYGYIGVVASFGEKSFFSVPYGHVFFGTIVMSIILLKDFFRSEIFSDNPTNIYIYLFIVFLLIIASFVLLTINCATYKYKDVKFFYLYPLTMFTVAFVMAAVLPYICTYIY